MFALRLEGTAATMGMYVWGWWKKEGEGRGVMMMRTVLVDDLHASAGTVPGTFKAACGCVRAAGK